MKATNFPWLANFPSKEVRELDLRKHALIEASAGTGKTFAVEHLVLRLLMENGDWKPEDVLLLSFTEKTAGELRDRIRKLLRLQIKGDESADGSGKKPIAGWTGVDLDRIRQLWMHCDDLAVHTLHAFCQASLLRDPIANGALIRAELADDRAVAEDALENLLRGPWARDPDRLARLRAALEIDGGDRWRDRLVKLALAWQPWRGDRIDPAPDPQARTRLEGDVAEALHDLKRGDLKRALAEVNAGSLPLGDYLERLPGGKKAGNAFGKFFGILDETSGDFPALESLVATFYGKYEHGVEKAGKTRAFKKGFASELESTRGRNNADREEWKSLAAACDRVLLLGLRAERETVLDGFRLRAEAVEELRAELAREKIRRGLISYEDMPKNLAAALDRNPDLAIRMRRRYKVCIVDEFQDTDPLQWKILAALCLNTRDDKESPPPFHSSHFTLHSSPSFPLPLFLVGDPKQAIYGFRGGDLRTYLAARAAFRAMALEGRAQGFGLDRNFRSRPELIAGLNAVFTHGNWFGAPAEIPRDEAWHLPADSGHVAFTPAQAGRTDTLPNGSAIVLREFGDEELPRRKADVEREVRRWIGARIVELTKGGAREPGDIAVLVRKNAEAEAVERHLRRRGVPCRVRRRGGVFHGPAADALRLLMEWIGDAASPDVQASILLLPFLRRNGEDWPRGRPAQCPPLIARWAMLARAGRWPEFFDSVLHESGYRARLAAPSASGSAPDAERFARLARILGEAGSAPGTPARALCDRFDALRRGEGGEEEDGAADDGDAAGGGGGAVTVMTLHMSKGLEFPVVFVAASGEGARPEFFTLRDQAGFRHVLDVKDAAAKAAWEAQARDEDRRLFYVAFTRAKDRLYVPLLPEKYTRGASGPLGGFAATALRAAANAQEQEGQEGQTGFHLDEEPIRDDAARPRNSGDDGAPGGGSRPAADREALLEAARNAFARRRRLASYSGLAAAMKHAGGSAAPELLLEDDGTRVLREEPATEDSGADAPETPKDAVAGPRPAFPGAEAGAGITAAELPPGAAAGTALHAILERTDFASALKTEDSAAWLELPGHRDRVEGVLRREGLDASCAPAAARAVWNTLRMPLPDPAGGPDFRLADLAGAACRHEVEFLLPFPQFKSGDAEEKLPEGIARSGTFLWGFIDLVFRHRDRYYLLDWKSNLLDHYDEASVRESMAKHRYDLQWKLYAVALDKWLAARLPDYDPDRHFGGVHYLYLRGAATDRFSGFRTRPTTDDLRRDFPAEIARLLRAPAEEGA